MWTDIVDGTGDVVATGEVNVQVPGSYVLSYNFTDAAGNEAVTVTRTIVVEDTTVPVITLNGDASITHEAGGEYTDEGAVWTDIVDGTGDVVATGEVNVQVPGSYVLSYNFTDAAGNEAVTVTRTIVVEDTTIPVITLTGDASITHEAGGEYTDEGAVWADIVDGTGDVVATGEVDVQVPGSYVLSYNFTDAAGNEAVTVTRTIVVVDTTIPVITLTGYASITHEAGGEYTDEGAVWVDIVDGTGDVVATGEVDVQVPGSYILSYNFTDSSGSEAVTVTRTIVVEDTTIPVITLTGDANITHEAGDEYSDEGAVWTDIVDGEGNITATGEVDILVPGNYVLSYNFTDAAGNEAVMVTRTIMVEDTTIPVITLTGDANITHEAGDEYTDMGAVWADIVDGEGNVTATGEVNVLVPGSYILSYNFSDVAGNEAATVIRTIQVVDTMVPEISLNGDANITHEAGDEYIDQGAVWTDIVDGEGNVTATGEVNVEVPGSYILSYNFSDVAGNEAVTVTRTIVVEDTTIPVITLTGDANITHEAGDEYIDQKAVWMDIVDGEGSIIATGEVDVLVPGSYVLSYNYTDVAGNEAVTVTRTIVVEDTTIPVITLNGDGNITHEAGDEYIDLGAVWMDIVDGEGNITATGEVDVLLPGSYVLSYNYTDAAGNEAVTVTRTIVVEDTTIPVIERLGEENMSSLVWNEWIDPWVDASDIVDGNLTQQVTREGEVDTESPGLYELIYRVTDEHGNSAFPVLRNVEVINRPPVGLTLSNNQIMENQPAESVVGQLSTNDPDDPNGERTYFYSLLEQDENISSSFFSVSEKGIVFTNEPLDYERNQSYELHIRTQDQFGAEFTDIIRVDVINAFTPIVSTLEPVVELDNLLLGGQVEHMGGLEFPIRTGVILSDEPIHSGLLSTNRVQEIESKPDENGSMFFTSVDLNEIKFQEASTLYVMAFAENSEGISYGLKESININPISQERDYWTGANALENREGWWSSSWFGTYYRSEESGWLLHLGLGWMYPAPANDGLWLWKESLNWLWTNEEVYPFLYSSDTGTWLYFYGDLNRKRLLYDYGLRKWVTLDEGEEIEEEGAR